MKSWVVHCRAPENFAIKINSLTDFPSLYSDTSFFSIMTKLFELLSLVNICREIFQIFLIFKYLSSIAD